MIKAIYLVCLEILSLHIARAETNCKHHSVTDLCSLLRDSGWPNNHQSASTNKQVRSILIKFVFSLAEGKFPESLAERMEVKKVRNFHFKLYHL